MLLRILVVYNIILAFNANYFFCNSAPTEKEADKILSGRGNNKQQVIPNVDDKGIIIKEAKCKGRTYRADVIYDTIQRACKAKDQNLGLDENTVYLSSFNPAPKDSYKSPSTEIKAPFYVFPLTDTVFKDQTHPTDRVVMNDECRLLAVVTETTRLSCAGNTCGPTPSYANCKLEYPKK